MIDRRGGQIKCQDLLPEAFQRGLKLGDNLVDWQVELERPKAHPAENPACSGNGKVELPIRTRFKLDAVIPSTVE